MNTLLCVQKLDKFFSQQQSVNHVLKNISMDIHKGEFCTIIGPNGCGKTTLLRLLAGLETPEKGNLKFQQNKPPFVSMVFQQAALFPWMNLIQNIQFIVKNRFDGQSVDTMAISRQYLNMIGLEQFATYLPHQISGGMKQRVSLARSFAAAPDLLLMDEPFVSLDYLTRIELQKLLLKIWALNKTTIVFVTHDIDEALRLSDRIIVLSPLPAEIKLDFTVDIPRPRSLNVIENGRYRDYFHQITELLCNSIPNQVTDLEIINR